MFTLLRLIVFSATYAGMLVHVKEDTGHIWFFTADTRSTPVSADSSLSKYIFSRASAKAERDLPSLYSVFLYVEWGDPVYTLPMLQFRP